MILAVNAGNTNIVIGGMADARAVFTARLGTDCVKTEDDYALAISAALSLRGINPADIDGSILACVVTELKPVLQAALRLLIGREPLTVGSGIKTGLDIKIDNPAQLGADMVATSVAACAEYPRPIIILDMGTATTLSVINQNGTYIGGMIMPGHRLSVDALSRNTSQLPRVDLEAPVRLIGSNTIDCMKSGAVYGTAAMLDGVVARVEEALATPAAAVIATGELAPGIVPYCKCSIKLDATLALRGLSLIYEKNK